MQQSDFEAIFAAMAGLPVTVRLLDPPLHEFLPDRTALAVELALTEPGPERTRLERLAERVRQLSEQNPMLGTRGCRLALLHPGIYAMQVRAIVRGGAGRRGARRGGADRDHDPAGGLRRGAAPHARAGRGGRSRRSWRAPGASSRSRSGR